MDEEEIDKERDYDLKQKTLFRFKTFKISKKSVDK